MDRKIDESLDLEELMEADPICKVWQNGNENDICGKPAEFHFIAKCSSDGQKYVGCSCRKHYGDCLAGRMACCTPACHLIDPASVVLI